MNYTLYGKTENMTSAAGIVVSAKPVSSKMSQDAKPVRVFENIL